MIRGGRAWLPAALWAAIIFGLSSFPTTPVDLGSGRDKLAHFATYAVLGFLLGHGQARAGLSVLWPLAIGVLYGASDELHQAFVPGRSPDLLDWVADSLGVLAGVFAYDRWRRSPAPRPQPGSGAIASSPEP